MSRKPEYLTNEQFVVVWMRHAVRGGSLADVYRDVAELCSATGRPAMPAASIAAKAAYLRAQGVKLPKLKVGAKPSGDTERLNKLVSAIVASGDDSTVGKVSELASVPDSGFEPESDPAPTIKEVVGRVSGKNR